MGMKMLVRDLMPCWYELGWRSSPNPALVIRIHKNFIRDASSLLETAWIISSLKEEFKLPSFAIDFDHALGFDGILVKKELSGEFSEFDLLIPNFTIVQDEICSDCRGSKKAHWGGESCFSCGGTGKEVHYDWHLAYKVSATLNVILTWLNWTDCEQVTSSSLVQLLKVEIVTMKRMHGCAIAGEYSISLANILRSFKKEIYLDEVTDPMRIAYARMLNETLRTLNHLRFLAIVRPPGRFSADCPGNACGIHPDHMYSEDPCRGYDFTSHNVDSPFQQLTLLVGLAALHDFVRSKTK